PRGESGSCAGLHDRGAGWLGAVGWRRKGRLMAGAPTRATSLVSVSAKSSADARPRFGPTIGTRDRPQRDQWIDVSTCPVHAAALESRLDDDLVGALGAAAANRVPGGLEGGVVHLRQTFGEVSHGAIPHFTGSHRISSQLDWQ